MTRNEGETDLAARATAVGLGRVLHAVLRVLGRPVQLNALALGVALGIPAAILFSANGLRAVDVVTLLHRSLVTRALLWPAWLALSAPALLALFEAPGSKTLRALRLPRAELLASLFLLATVTELPWAVLFARGAGFFPAWAAVTLAIALGASSLVALRRPRWFGAVALGAGFVLIDPPALLGALAGTIAVPFALDAAWRSALEQPRFYARLLRPMHPLFALYAAHVLRLARSARSRLMVALASGVGGIAGLVFSFRNDPTERPLQRALTALALPLTLAAAACVAPVIESEARLRWLIRSLRVRRTFVLPAFLLAIATPSSALAATAGVMASSAAHSPVGVLGSVLLMWALTLSAAVAGWGRLLEWRSRRTAGTFAAGVTLIAALALVASYSW